MRSPALESALWTWQPIKSCLLPQISRPAHWRSTLKESIVRRARDLDVLLYSGTGNANGTDGDTLLLGPPFVVTDAELVRIADAVATAVDEVTSSMNADGPTMTTGARVG